MMTFASGTTALARGSITALQLNANVPSLTVDGTLTVGGTEVGGAPSWQLITLEANLIALTTGGTPAYAVVNGFVHLFGAVTRHGSVFTNGDDLFTLPAGAIPAVRMRLLAGSNSGQAYMQIAVESTTPDQGTNPGRTCTTTSQ